VKELVEHLEIKGEAQSMVDSNILKKLKGAVIECENPNEVLYKFEGNLTLD
jgi:hypothetical protein